MDTQASLPERNIVVCGYSGVGAAMVNMLSTPSIAQQLIDQHVTYTVFDLDPNQVTQGVRENKNVMYGDGSNAQVLESCRVNSPLLFIVSHNDEEVKFKMVERIRSQFACVPIYTR